MNMDLHPEKSAPDDSLQREKIEDYLPKPGETLRDSQVYPKNVEGSGREALMQILPVNEVRII